jgi:hypothetical protein
VREVDFFVQNSIFFGPTGDGNTRENKRAWRIAWPKVVPFWLKLPALEFQNSRVLNARSLNRCQRSTNQVVWPTAES